MTVDRDARPAAILAVHPGAEMYGSDRMFLESVTGMVDAGWRVLVVLPDEGPLTSSLQDVGATVVQARVPVLRKSALRPGGLLRLVGVGLVGLATSVRLLRGADAVYVSTVTLPWWLVLARVLRRPTVCHVHEAEGSAPALLRHALSFPLGLADGLVVNSEFALGVLRRTSSRSAQRAEVVTNGVPGPDEFHAPRPVLGGGVRLLYVGRLSPRKGVDVAVDAVAELQRRGVEAHLDVVGAAFSGYEWYEQQLRDQVRDLGLQGLVTLHGFRPRVWDHLADADVVLVPSRVDEPFGNTAVEAVLAARPVVVSDTSGLREASAGYPCAQAVDPGDPVALADAVHRVVDDWPGWSRAATASAVTAAGRHDPARYRRRVVGHVRRLLGSSRQAVPAAGGSP